MGRTAQERMLPAQRQYFGSCDLCGADYRTAGSLEPYDLLNGSIKVLCQDCAIKNWDEIVMQPMF